uniref:t-SNARE coiled-coil homology domain-containing protein n=2 Tax=Oryza brachyantha TaxID=4533 RepID=J3L2Z5_ORYBR
MRKMKQDEGLDIIGEGLETLKNMASDMNEELDRQVPLMDEIETKADRANADLKNTNVRLKETVLQLRSSRNFCIDIVLLCIILGIAAYLYKALPPSFRRSATAAAIAMSAVNITSVAVLDNPTAFLNPFQFEISYECLIPLEDDLEWKLVYVGSAEDESYDQMLESVLVGPVNVGTYRFVLQADPPDPSKIREEDIIGVTVLLLTCSYMGQEFIRVGYYVNNDYDDEQLREEPPAKLLIDRVQRNVLTDKPRVTKFTINFHPETSTGAGQEQQQQQQPP